jgi:hypothetical protein
MGKKRGFHVVNVQSIVFGTALFEVEYKRSKCRHAPTHTTYIRAKDELDAYKKVKERTNEQAARQGT